MATLFAEQPRINGWTVSTTTVSSLLAAYKYFKSNPDGLVSTGIWYEEAWSAGPFFAWFWSCLLDRIFRDVPKTGRKMSGQYQIDLRHDAQIIRDYYQRRIVHPGRNILRIPELKRRYPHIDHPKTDYWKGA